MNPYGAIHGKTVRVRFMGVNGNWTEEQKRKFSETSEGVIDSETYENMIVIGNDVIGIANLLTLEIQESFL